MPVWFIRRAFLCCKTFANFSNVKYICIINVLCMSSGTCTHFQTCRNSMCHCLYTVLVAVLYLEQI